MKLTLTNNKKVSTEFELSNSNDFNKEVILGAFQRLILADEGKDVIGVYEE